MFVCETLLLDVVAPEEHQNELSRPTFGSLRKNFARWAITWKTSKKIKIKKLREWALARDNTGHVHTPVNVPHGKPN